MEPERSSQLERLPVHASLGCFTNMAALLLFFVYVKRVVLFFFWLHGNRPCFLVGLPWDDQTVAGTQCI
jgi:hypothetical protein